MGYLKITWRKSCIGRNPRQRKVIQSLGLRKLNHSVIHSDSPTIRGMVEKVVHLIEVEEVIQESEPTSSGTSRVKS